tara:strand:+ start:1036 stop:1281 length:246 start_codon:yes stop_codon:yes gene_type:complete
MRTIQIDVRDDGNDRYSSYDDTKKRVEAYLYSNFEVSDIVNAIGTDGRPKIIVRGEDVAGFTAEAQAMRLQSGLIAAQVVN